MSCKHKNFVRFSGAIFEKTDTSFIWLYTFTDFYCWDCPENLGRLITSFNKSIGKQHGDSVHG